MPRLPSLSGLCCRSFIRPSLLKVKTEFGRERQGGSNRCRLNGNVRLPIQNFKARCHRRSHRHFNYPRMSIHGRSTTKTANVSLARRMYVLSLQNPQEEVGRLLASICGLLSILFLVAGAFPGPFGSFGLTAGAVITATVATFSGSDLLAVINLLLVVAIVAVVFLIVFPCATTGSHHHLFVTSLLPHYVT
jgi:hypothetical protein